MAKLTVRKKLLLGLLAVIFGLALILLVTRAIMVAIAERSNSIDGVRPIGLNEEIWILRQQKGLPVPIPVRIKNGVDLSSYCQSRISRIHVR